MQTIDENDKPEELERIRNLLSFERDLWTQNIRFIAGLDEVGRGPLAGPVVAAAVIFPPDVYIPHIDDSKKLTQQTRENLFDVITQTALTYAIASADVGEIDRYNILQASFLAMQRALDHLNTKPEFLLVDGKLYPRQSIPFKTIVKGDSRCFSIAAASILAKVTRDNMMSEYDRVFPEYGFEQHKGYATAAHLDAIEANGFCEIHRKSFHPRRFSGQLSLFEEQDGETA